MNPIIGKITSYFGKRKHPVTGIESFHNGIDIACKTGTPVLAPEDGVIINLWDDEKGGKSLAMISYTGVRFGFAHLSKQIVSELDEVKEGQTIAFSGSTGRVTGPHLHFTVMRNGTYVDPLEYFDYIEKPLDEK